MAIAFTSAYTGSPGASARRSAEARVIRAMRRTVPSFSETSTMAPNSSVSPSTVTGSTFWKLESRGGASAMATSRARMRARTGAPGSASTLGTTSSPPANARYVRP